jgi:hypothetical protein
LEENGSFYYHYQWTSILTHVFSKLKASVSAKTNIYDLAVSLTKKSNCTVTLELCARVALMVCVALITSAIVH